MNRFIILFVTVLLLAGCASWHVDPLSGDTASLIVKPIRVVKGETFGPDVWVKVDGKRVFELVEFSDPVFKNKTWKIKQPGTRALVTAGLHEVKLDISAFQETNDLTYVKENTIKTQWLFEKDHTYEISVEIPAVVADPPNANSRALVNIVDRDNSSEIYREELVLEQKSRIAQGSQSELATDIINTVIIPSTIH